MPAGIRPLLGGHTLDVLREFQTLLPDRIVLALVAWKELGLRLAGSADVVVLDRHHHLDLAVVIDPRARRREALEKSLGGRLLVIDSADLADRRTEVIHGALAAHLAGSADLGEVDYPRVTSVDPNIVRTYLSELDLKIAGFGGGELTLIGGVTGVGKSSFLRHLAIANAITRRIPTLMVSLESAPERIARELVGTVSGHGVRRLDLMSLTEPEEALLQKTAREIQDAPLQLVTRPDITVPFLDGLVRGLDPRPRLLLLDYLELMAGEGPEEALLGLKRLVRRHRLAGVVVTNSMSDADLRTSDNRPALISLKDMGLHTDTVLLLHREEVYDLRSDNAYVTEIHVAKNRTGPTGVVNIAYHEESQRFQDLEVAYEEEFEVPTP